MSRPTTWPPGAARSSPNSTGSGVSHAAKVPGMSDLSHVDDAGRVRMVDVGGKPVSRRRAIARARLRVDPATAARLRDLPKGDALATAELAGVMAAKRTSELIPLCHQLPLSVVE